MLLLLLYSPEKVDKQTVMGIEELLLCLSSTTIKLGFKTTVCYEPKTVSEATKKKKTYDCLSRKRRRRSYMMDSFSLSLSSKHPLQNIKSFQIHSITFSSTKNIHLVAQYQSKDFHRVCVPACKKISVTKECYNRTRISCKMTGRKKTTQAGNSS